MCQIALQGSCQRFVARLYDWGVRSTNEKDALNEREQASCNMYRTAMSKSLRSTPIKPGAITAVLASAMHQRTHVPPETSPVSGTQTLRHRTSCQSSSLNSPNRLQLRRRRRRGWTRRRWCWFGCCRRRSCSCSPCTWSAGCPPRRGCRSCGIAWPGPPGCNSRRRRCRLCNKPGPPGCKCRRLRCRSYALA